MRCDGSWPAQAAACPASAVAVAAMVVAAAGWENGGGWCAGRGRLHVVPLWAEDDRQFGQAA